MSKDKKKRKKNKSDYGENFIPPDGGYAWVICVTSGLSNLSILPVFQQFGLLYRDKLLGIGLTHSAITSILNANSAISSLTGFLNGPMFRRFSYRQVGIVGSLISTIAIYLTSISNSFGSFLFTFGILLAFGFGITISANSLVFNVYFKEKRSKASSWAWTITGIGPIIFPYIITYLTEVYGADGTILIVTAISAHALVASLTYQPVLWYANKGKKSIQQLKVLNDDEKYTKLIEDNICKTCNCTIEDYADVENSSYSEEEEASECEDETKINDIQIITQDPETPMMHTKENCFKSSENLAMKYTRQLSKYSVSKSIERRLSLIPPDIVHNEKKCKIETKICKCNPIILDQTLNKDKPKLSLYHRFVKYFELDLLKDLTFLNIVIGQTLSMFAEINFSLLTPFILSDFELQSHQIAFLMSMPAIPDLACRFLIQFIVKKVKWDNRIYYLLGIFAMTVARSIISLRPSYNIMCITFFCLGIGKAFRTIFYGIIIPDYVPLKSLPAALGINRLFGGIFPMIFGSFVGIIRDRSNYQVTLLFLNSLSMITVISWTVEIVFFRRKKKKHSVADVEKA